MKTIILTALLAAIFISCGPQKAEKKETPSDTAALETHPHEHESEEIVLNDGEKWKVDSLMLVHIRNMEMDIRQFEESKNKDYHQFAEQLQANCDLLTGNCTMEGQAHDELHKWLLPYLDLVQNLSEAKSNEASASIYEQIRTSFDTFNQFFE